MTDTFTLFAQAAGGAPTGPASMLGSPIFLFLGMMMLMYFLIFRPQQQQKKKLAQQLAAAKKGDKVITIGGIHGVVNHKGDTTVSLKVSEGVFITMEAANIASIIPAGSSKEEAPAKIEGKK